MSKTKYLFLLIITAAVTIAASSSSFSQDKKEEEVLTRAQVIERLSASDFIKQKIGSLLNWGVGYDITKINRTNLAPTIKDISVAPIKAPPDDRTVISLIVKVDDPGGLADIRGVRADLSSIGRLPNTMLVDDGLWGDENPNDGVYTLQTSVSRKISEGSKDIPVAVSNKKGWVAIGKTNVDIQINPTITMTSATPRRIKADGISKIKLLAKVQNPGRLEDIRSVTVDLTPIGSERETAMYDDATHGDDTAKDGIFTLETVVKPSTPPGEKKLKATAVNLILGKGYGDIVITVE